MKYVGKCHAADSKTGTVCAALSLWTAVDYLFILFYLFYSIA